MGEDEGNAIQRRKKKMERDIENKRKKTKAAADDLLDNLKKGELVDQDGKIDADMDVEKSITNGKWQAAAGIGAFFAGGIGASSLLFALNINDFAHGISNSLQMTSVAICVVCLLAFAVLTAVAFKKGCVSGAAYAAGSVAFSGLIGFGLYNVVGFVPVDPTPAMHASTPSFSVVGVACLVGGALLLFAAVGCACKRQCCRKHTPSPFWVFGQE